MTVPNRTFGARLCRASYRAPIRLAVPTVPLAVPVAQTTSEPQNRLKIVRARILSEWTTGSQGSGAQELT